MRRTRGDLERVEGMLRFDRVRSLGGALVGIDEAGRGPLAGPVVAAAVSFPPDVDPILISGLNDSKALSEKRRESLAETIRECATAFGIGQASPREIDALDIEKATFLAMRRALLDSGMIPDVVLVDGARDPGLGLPAETVVKGDASSAAIAAASILAKTTRDRYMECIEEETDQRYGFRAHKGYPTERHVRALRVFGPDEAHHRLTFKPVAQNIRKTKPSPVFLEAWEELGRALPPAERSEIKEFVQARTPLLETHEAWMLSRRIEETEGFQIQDGPPPNKRGVGAAHEQWVQKRLEAKGLQILERNYHTRLGEIDLIAREGERILFIEVKMRASNRYGSAAESVSIHKRRKMISAALDYLSRFPDAVDCRFDVVALDSDGTGRLTFNHIESAFDLGEEGFT